MTLDSGKPVYSVVFDRFLLLRHGGCIASKLFDGSTLTEGETVRLLIAGAAMRSSWRGYLRLSLVSIPVQAFSAAEPEDGGIRFNQLHKKCHSRIQYKKFCPVHGEVTKDEIVSGYQYAPNQYVVMDEEELERVTDEGGISIQSFIPPAAVDPSYYSGRTYYLAPDGDAGKAPYALLCQAMREEKRYALAQAVMWGRNRLLLIRPDGDLLVMEMMQFGSQVRPSKEIDNLIPHEKSRAAELKLAKTLIAESYDGTVAWSEQVDERADDLRRLVEAKVKGRDDVIEVKPVRAGAPSIDLFEALKRSVGTKEKKSKRTGKSEARPKLRVVAHRQRRRMG